MLKSGYIGDLDGAMVTGIYAAERQQDRKVEI